jgi:hypothetical protein
MVLFHNNPNRLRENVSEILCQFSKSHFLFYIIFSILTKNCINIFIENHMFDFYCILNETKNHWDNEFYSRQTSKDAQ